jgi:carbonic anhydrase/acetyltransferase-like protein (isoleucine patch superfamily)
MIASFGARAPAVDPSAFVVDSAVVVGDVVVGTEASLWFHVVVRGDVERVRIGARTNVQDNATVHVTSGRWPTLLGEGVTVGTRPCSMGARSATIASSASAPSSSTGPSSSRSA